MIIDVFNIFKVSYIVILNNRKIFCVNDLKFAHNIYGQKGKSMNKNDKLKFEILTRELRLLYYNNYLLERDVITKHEHNRINLAIISKYGKRNCDELGESSSVNLSTIRHK